MDSIKKNDPFFFNTTFPYRIDGVLLDFDGTLTRPGALDFSILKKKIGCPSHMPVLEYMEEIQDSLRRQEMTRILDGFERSGAEISQPNEGAQEIVAAIKAAGLPVGILTRNSRASLSTALANFVDLDMADFDAIVTREDPVRIKPSAQGVLLAAQRMGVKPARLLVVGDFRFDMEAGQAAGALTTYLANKEPVPSDIQCSFVVDTLLELEPVLEQGISLPAGKLPNAFLDVLLQTYPIDDPSVIVGPSVGEDTAAIDIHGQSVLVLKADPITFATESIGRYTVLINANDMATAGVAARWMLATVLLPKGFSRSQVRFLFQDLHDACSREKIALCGGHTEITDAVNRPIVAGTMAGTVTRKDLIRKSRMAPGDHVLVTKGVAVEGTAVIAAEFKTLLLEKGMTEDEIDRCIRFQTMISILPEARIAWTVEGVSALHDVTEGGIATALDELSRAGGKGIAIRFDRVPVYPLTRRLTSMLGIDPLGLIGSGSLLICCRPKAVPRLISRLRKGGVEVADVGEVTEKSPGVEATLNNRPVVWPRFEVDEITRLFGQ